MASDDVVRDRDETRRLLYMALVCSRTEHHDLAGTLINALRHHQGAGDELLEDHIIALIEEGSPGAETWAREQIARLSAGG